MDESGVTGVLWLNHQVAVTVPSTRDENVPLDDVVYQAYVDEALTLFSVAFGGASAVELRGAYVLPSGELVIERSTRVYAHTAAMSSEVEDLVIAFALKLKSELGQHSVAIEINGRLGLVGLE